ncbi:MAG: hypothetical protein IJ511_06745 [Bacteroides sp.]|nr:hypothetical protein [Bacteroides sp.]
MNTNKKIIFNNVRMDSVAIFSDNQVTVMPCPWEAAKGEEVTGGKRMNFKGRTVLDETGRMQIMPYNIGSQGPRYETLFTTEHCTVQRTQGGGLVERWVFRRELPIHKVWEIRERERASIDAFFLTLKEDLK